MINRRREADGVTEKTQKFDHSKKLARKEQIRS